MDAYIIETHWSYPGRSFGEAQPAVSASDLLFYTSR